MYSSIYRNVDQWVVKLNAKTVFQHDNLLILNKVCKLIYKCSGSFIQKLHKKTTLKISQSKFLIETSDSNLDLIINALNFTYKDFNNYQVLQYFCETDKNVENIAK